MIWMICRPLSKVTDLPTQNHAKGRRPTVVVPHYRSKWRRRIYFPPLVLNGLTRTPAPAGFVPGMVGVPSFAPAVLGPGSSALTSTTEGPTVPQTRYRPHTSSDQHRHVILQEPIHFFVSSPDGPKPGIPLRDAITSKFMRLIDRDEQLLQGWGPSVTLRLSVRTNFLLLLHIRCIALLMSTCPQWKGYQPWSRQISTRDFRSPPGPITKAKLSKNVAKSVQRFIEVCDTRFRALFNLLSRQNTGIQRPRDGAWR